MEWDYSGRKRSNGQKKKIGKANKKMKREKVTKSKRRRSEWTKEKKREERGYPGPHGA